MAEVRIGEETFSARQDERLSELLIRIGKAIPQPCGGRGVCGKCRVLVCGKETLACRYVIQNDIDVVLPEEAPVQSETAAAAAPEAGGETAIVLDIGTTTLAAAVVSLDEKRIVRVSSRTNPQQAFGADVMNRIAYCANNGPGALQKAVVGAVNALLDDLGVSQSETMYVAGNTAMLHLFFGIDCSSMGAAPYTPVFLASRTVPGESVGLGRVGRIESLPCAASFVGADLTAGLNLIGMPPAGRYRLLIDLGTNAEVILFTRDSAVCTAAAAGPCFEGANISCGMSASPGTVCAYSAMGYATIGGAKPVGICGTGLVDVIAALLDDGTIDESGYMPCGTFTVAPGVTLTQADVRQYQLAKSAVCSAVRTLLQLEGVTFDNVDKAYISGGFSAKIDIRNAVATGLLPQELLGKCVASGNTSLLGTARYAFEKNDLSSITSMMRYVDLAADPVFSELFIGNLSFNKRGS